MTDRKEQLRDVIVNGLAIDIFEAEEALALDKEIGKNAEQINEGRFGVLFGTFQNLLVKHLILAVTRIFEPKNQRHPIRSIPTALDILHKYANEIKIEQKQFVIERLGEPKDCEDKLQALSDADINCQVVKYFSEDLCRVDGTKTYTLSQALTALKAARDKKIAHHEVIKVSDFPTTNYAEIEQLLDYAKRFVETVGNGYFRIAYEEYDGKYSLSSDACLASRQLKQLFIKCEVSKSSEHG